MKSIILFGLLLLTGTKNSAQKLQVTDYSGKAVSTAGINGIFQDKKGWMWFSAGSEVLRYDGDRFHTYPPASGSRMQFCFRILEVKDEIWVIAVPQLMKIRGDSLYPANFSNEGPEINSHLEYQGRDFFLGRNGLYEYKDNRFEPRIVNDSLIFSRLESLYHLSGDWLVSFSEGKAFYLFDLRNDRCYSVPMKVIGMKADQKGSFYTLIEGQGIFLLSDISVNGHDLSIQKKLIHPVTSQVWGKFEWDGKENFWVVRQFQELIQYSGDRQRSFTEKNGLPGLWFFDMFTDREKNIWLGLNSGLCKISNVQWDRYTLDEGLLSNHILFLSGSSGNSAYIGTQNGVNIFDNGNLKPLTRSAKPLHCFGLAEHQDQVYFFNDNIIYTGRVDREKGILRNESKWAELPADVRELIFLPGNRTIISTTKGIYALSAGREPVLLTDTIYFRKIVLDRSGRLWAGEFVGGLHCFRMDEKDGRLNLRTIFTIDTLDHLPVLNSVRAIATDKKGNVFVGTRTQGLFILKMNGDRLEKVDHYSEKNRLSSRTVWDLLVDKEDNCWIANARQLVKASLVNGEWQFTNEGDRRQASQAQLLLNGPGDQVWVYSHPGLMIIRSGEERSAHRFQLAIQEIRVNNEKVDTGMPAKFPYRKNNIEIHFSTSSYINEGAVLYSWRLRDDAEWTDPAPAHSVNYSALQPGKYQFSVRAMGIDGNWSEQVARYSFEIRSPFWQQAWFIATVIAILSFALFIFYRYRLKKVRELQEVRNNIARDLHDEIGSTLTSIQILSSVSHRNLEQDGQKSKQLMEKVIEQSEKIQQDMSDIVWAIRPENDKMENLTARMREFLSHTLEPRGIRIHFDADEAVLRQNIGMEQRRDFFLVFKEAVNNLAKYSQTKQANIQLEKINGEMRLRVRDEGIGFDMSGIKSTGGLENMRRRAESLKGELKISSEPGKGTTVDLKIPATS